MNNHLLVPSSNLHHLPCMLESILSKLIKRILLVLHNCKRCRKFMKSSFNINKSRVHFIQVKTIISLPHFVWVNPKSFITSLSMILYTNDTTQRAASCELENTKTTQELVKSLNILSPISDYTTGSYLLRGNQRNQCMRPTLTIYQIHQIL